MDHNITWEDVRKAFCDIMDGTTVNNLVDMTGMPLSRAEEIVEIYKMISTMR